MVVLLAAAHAAPTVPIAATPGANLQAPTWSPEGTRLSYEANFHQVRRVELYVGEPREGGFVRVLPRTRPGSGLTVGFKSRPPGSDVAHELAWSPTLPGTFVYAADNDAGDYDLVLSTGALVAPMPGADGLPTWSPDGRSLAWSSGRSGEGDLYLLGVDALDQAPTRLTSMPASSELWAAWSPDGRQLVFVAHGATGDNLWWLSAIGAEPMLLVPWSGNQLRPTFSPTTPSVAFYANHEDPDRLDLYVVDLGSSPRLVATGVVPDGHGPCWSPDGRHLIYVADDDSALDPVRATLVADPSRTTTLPLDTVGHRDLALTTDGATWVLAVVAQGRVDDPVRDWSRLFLARVPAPD